MIELKKKEGSDSGKDYQLLINGALVEEAHVFPFRRKKPEAIVVFAWLYESHDSERLAAHLFTELPAELEEVKLKLDFDWPETVDEVQVRRYRDDKGSFQIGFKFGFDYEDWKGPYSFAEYAEAFSQVVNGMNRSDIAWEQDDESLANGFWIRFTTISPQTSIIEEVSLCSSTLGELTLIYVCLIAIQRLVANIRHLEGQLNLAQAVQLRTQL